VTDLAGDARLCRDASVDVGTQVAPVEQQWRPVG
jgi:hypothetical protein